MHDRSGDGVSEPHDLRVAIVRRDDSANTGAEIMICDSQRQEVLPDTFQLRQSLAELPSPRLVQRDSMHSEAMPWRLCVGTAVDGSSAAEPVARVAHGSARRCSTCTSDGSAGKSLGRARGRSITYRPPSRYRGQGDGITAWAYGNVQTPILDR